MLSLIIPVYETKVSEEAKCSLRPQEAGSARLEKKECYINF
jgi:hypothetical protein